MKKLSLLALCVSVALSSQAIANDRISVRGNASAFASTQNVVVENLRPWGDMNTQIGSAQGSIFTNNLSTRAVTGNVTHINNGDYSSLMVGSVGGAQSRHGYGSNPISANNIETAAQTGNIMVVNGSQRPLVPSVITNTAIGSIQGNVQAQGNLSARAATRNVVHNNQGRRSSLSIGSIATGNNY